MGVLVKDLDAGLVDFPTLFRGDEEARRRRGSAAMGAN